MTTKLSPVSVTIPANTFGPGDIKYPKTETKITVGNQRPIQGKELNLILARTVQLEDSSLKTLGLDISVIGTQQAAFEKSLATLTSQQLEILDGIQKKSLQDPLLVSQTFKKSLKLLAQSPKNLKPLLEIYATLGKSLNAVQENKPESAKQALETFVALNRAIGGKATERQLNQAADKSTPLKPLFFQSLSTGKQEKIRREVDAALNPPPKPPGLLQLLGTFLGSALDSRTVKPDPAIEAGQGVDSIFQAPLGNQTARYLKSSDETFRLD